MKHTGKIATGIFVITAATAAWLYGWRVQAPTVKPTVTAPLTADADSLCAHKKERLLYVYSKGRVAKQYHLSLGGQPVGAKHFEGDNKTPEGLYHISVKNGHSKYHLSLGVSYPSPADRTYAAAHGKPTGGDVMIHGLPNGTKVPEAAFVKTDWTAGCMAVTNQEIEELFAHVNVGTPIRIVP
jgi:murein L,D-transpeptidase YafK